MKLWHLESVVASTSKYDYAHDFVIRAETEASARSIAMENAGGETTDQPDKWLNPDLSSCVELLSDGPVGIIVMAARDAS